MKRRTLDFVFSIGGAGFAVLLLVLGLVLKDQADFASDYVDDQLSAQQIRFTPTEFLAGEEAAPGGDCLVENGNGDETDRLLNTGKEAECYANQYIGYHLAESATEAGFEGETYATMGDVIRGENGLAAQLAAAEEAGDPTEDLQAQLDSANGLRDTMFRGETLRGLLLTTYGFSIFGARADTAALVCFLAAALLFLLSVAGFWHASRTPRDATVLT